MKLLTLEIPIWFYQVYDMYYFEDGKKGARMEKMILTEKDIARAKEAIKEHVCTRDTFMDKIEHMAQHEKTQYRIMKRILAKDMAANNDQPLTAEQSVDRVNQLVNKFAKELKNTVKPKDSDSPEEDNTSSDNE